MSLGLELREKFSRAMSLSEVESRQDPSTEPYRSKYTARELLKELKAALGHRAGAEAEAEAGEQRLPLAVLEYQLGLNHVETEELSAGEEHLAKCVSLLQGERLSPRAVLIYTDAENQLGILWAGLGEIEKAQKYLEDAEALYNQYMREIGTAPYDPQDHFMAEEEMLSEQERHKRFEKVATQTLYYLAQVYKHLDKDEKAAHYCHTTLQRQLETRDYNPLEWIVNAATLSQYYISKQLYMEARLCLAGATVIFNELGDGPLEAAAEESEDELHDKLRRSKSDISRCWIKYCLLLLQDARKLLEDDIAELDSERQDELRAQQAREEEEKERERKKAVQFGSSETFDSILSAEEKVTCMYPVDFQSARKVFLFGQNHMQESKKFYQLDGYTRDYVEVVQDHSALFKVLAFFEEDHERRCKMHKRRVDMLEAVYKELNPQHYLLLCRQLQYEIAETYYEMMMLKVTIANGLEDLDQRNVKKINHLGNAAISYYQLFLDSLRDANKQFPSQLEQDVLRPALFAKFRMGYLHNKIITAEPQSQLENTQKALDCYSYVVDYCQSHEEASETVKAELELCTEMMGLLASRVKQLQAKMLAKP